MPRNAAWQRDLQLARPDAYAELTLLNGELKRRTRARCEYASPMAKEAACHSLHSLHAYTLTARDHASTESVYLHVAKVFHFPWSFTCSP